VPSASHGCGDQEEVVIARRRTGSAGCLASASRWLREIRDELRGLNAWLEAKASTWLVGAGIACPGSMLAGVMAGLTLLTRR
jgi:hypothetical protein